jgi:hypothetical protein
MMLLVVEEEMVRTNVVVSDLFGDVAQLGEHCLCKAGVRGSTPLVSTSRKPLSETGSGFLLAVIRTAARTAFFFFGSSECYARVF